MSVCYMQKNERIIRKSVSPKKIGKKHLCNRFGQLSFSIYSFLILQPIFLYVFSLSSPKFHDLPLFFINLLLSSPFLIFRSFLKQVTTRFLQKYFLINPPEVSINTILLTFFFTQNYCLLSLNSIKQKFTKLKLTKS